MYAQEERKHFVFAICGTKNVSSMLSNVRFVSNGNGGILCSEVEELLSNKTFLAEYVRKGFRISATGHSVGGFVCQYNLILFEFNLIQFTGPRVCCFQD